MSNQQTNDRTHAASAPVAAPPEAVAAFEEMRVRYEDYDKFSDAESWLSFSDFCRVEANY
ncbi:hypothetical protein [Burkholderia sp. Ac-20349]|uniref:hypothetical protein n=1 Tax=Burkholderia sp. Ac-20349 TaxID=2703893 RepID=UPI00197C2B95|nr:hypothetical protein [Burkholderia sp. Ac-20349]MBN3839328.1 hypothetical protein [Burkholderia sp. Ac-20349]